MSPTSLCVWPVLYNKRIMKTYNHIHFSQICEILMQAAMGVSAVCGYKYTTSDMVYALSNMKQDLDVDGQPCYIAIREQGTENGTKDFCKQRCMSLCYPLVIAKIEKDKVCDYNMSIMFTHGGMDRDNNNMEQEFNSL